MAVIEIDRGTREQVSQYVAPQDVIGVDTSAATTAEEVLKTAGLAGWRVHLRPVQTVQHALTANGVTNYDEQLACDDTFAVVRTNPETGAPQYIGTVGKKYEVLQNEELAGFLNDLVGSSGGQLTRAGDFYGKGRQFFLTLDLPTDVLIGGRDLINHNITLFSSHDGSTSVIPVVTNRRVACQNERQSVIGSGIASTRVRHTVSATQRLQVVRNILGIAWKTAKAFDAKAETMINAKIEEKTFWEIVAKIWEPAAVDSARGQTLQRQRLESIASRLHGPESDDIKGTAWAAYNAITSHLQHSHADSVTNATRALRSATVRNSAALAEKLFHDYALSA